MKSAGSEHMSEEDIHDYSRTTCGAAAPFEPFIGTGRAAHRRSGRAS